MGNLKADQLRTLVKQGRYGDGGGLYFTIGKNGSRSWVQRIWVQGRRLDKGLGGLASVSLAQARKLADSNRVQVAQGRDPWAGRGIRRTPKASGRAPGVPTFKELALQVHAQRTETRWKNQKHVTSWLQTLERHAFPRLGDMPVTEITRRDVLDVLLPIWTSIPESARRIRQRMRAVFELAMAQGDVDFNPAGEAVNGALDPMPRLVHGHHAALPWRDVPAAIATIRDSEAWLSTRLAFEFLILTAARSGEARGATWEEIDQKARVWTIPGERMKAGKPHRVPLSIQASVLLDVARQKLAKDPERRSSGLVFPAPGGKALSDNALSVYAPGKMASDADRMASVPARFGIGPPSSPARHVKPSSWHWPTWSAIPRRRRTFGRT